MTLCRGALQVTSPRAVFNVFASVLIAERGQSHRAPVTFARKAGHIFEVMVRFYAVGSDDSDTKRAHEQLCSSEQLLGKSGYNLLARAAEMTSLLPLIGQGETKEERL